MNQVSTKAQLKAQLKKYATEQGIQPEAIFQIYLIDRFLDRLAKCEFKKNFVLKGGVLMARLASVSTRSTQDVDITLVDVTLSEQNIRRMVQAVCEVPLDDNTEWTIAGIQPIRDNDIYGGFRVALNVTCFSSQNSVKIDFSTGDIITPKKKSYEFKTILMDGLISLFGYNLETVLAEKVESMLSLGVSNTRMKDFFDIYWLLKNKLIDNATFNLALHRTAIHRGHLKVLSSISEILESLSKSNFIKSQWTVYSKKYKFAKDISFQGILEEVQKLLIPSRIYEMAKDNMQNDE